MTASLAVSLAVSLALSSALSSALCGCGGASAPPPADTDADAARLTALRAPRALVTPRQRPTVGCSPSSIKGALSAGEPAAPLADLSAPPLAAPLAEPSTVHTAEPPAEPPALILAEGPPLEQRAAGGEGAHLSRAPTPAPSAALPVRFRYVSSRVGSSELIEEYCVDEELAEGDAHAFDTPPAELRGDCPAELTCSSAAAHKSGPIAPAYFWAAASLAMMREGVRNASARNSYQELDESGLSSSGVLTERVSVQETRFALDEHTSCLYRLKLFEDKLTHGRADLERFTRDAPKMLSAASSHTLWMERSATAEGGERLLMSAESSSESYGEGVLLERALLCERARGEISALGAPGLRFWAREVGDEWIVEAAAARPAP